MNKHKAERINDRTAVDGLVNFNTKMEKKHVSSQAQRLPLDDKFDGIENKKR